MWRLKVRKYFRLAAKMIKALMRKNRYLQRKPQRKKLIQVEVAVLRAIRTLKALRVRSTPETSPTIKVFPAELNLNYYYLRTRGGRKEGCPLHADNEHDLKLLPRRVGAALRRPLIKCLNPII
jgi:hypothetical protein